MPSDRSAVEQGVKFALDAMQAGAQIENTRKEQEMNEVKLGWFDRLLIKIALAKAVARHCEDVPHSASRVASAFKEINRQ